MIKESILTIWTYDGETPWIIEAWDSYTVEENPSGWADALEKANAQKGDREIRVIEIEVPTLWKKIEEVFEPPTIEGEIK